MSVSIAMLGLLIGLALTVNKYRKTYSYNISTCDNVWVRHDATNPNQLLFFYDIHDNSSMADKCTFYINGLEVYSTEDLTKKEFKVESSKGLLEDIKKGEKMYMKFTMNSGVEDGVDVNIIYVPNKERI